MDLGFVKMSSHLSSQMTIQNDDPLLSKSTQIRILSPDKVQFE